MVDVVYCQPLKTQRIQNSDSETPINTHILQITKTIVSEMLSGGNS